MDFEPVGNRTEALFHRRRIVVKIDPCAAAKSLHPAGHQIDVIGVELAATPVGATAPRFLLVTASIASDLAPIGRSFRWTGVAQDGAALPAGAYDVTLRVAPQARPGARYDVGGLVVTWTP